MADFPWIRELKHCDIPTPNGVIAPIPVTTIRCIDYECLEIRFLLMDQFDSLVVLE